MPHFKKNFLILLLFLFLAPNVRSEETEVILKPNTPISTEQLATTHTIFDDKMLLEGYAKKYNQLPKEIILEMIKDDTLNPFKSAAAVMVFSQKYAAEIFSKEKRGIEKILLRRLNKTNSPFVDVEVMCALCQLDRYRYFKSMVPALIQKLSHYNDTVNENAFACLDSLTQNGNGRTREARIIFNMLRKTLFLSRKRLATTTNPDPKLKQKLKLLRWSTKILGSQELNKLPKEIMHLL